MAVGRTREAASRRRPATTNATRPTARHDNSGRGHLLDRQAAKSVRIVFMRSRTASGNSLHVLVVVLLALGIGLCTGRRRRRRRCGRWCLRVGQLGRRRLLVHAHVGVDSRSDDRLLRWRLLGLGRQHRRCRRDVLDGRRARARGAVVGLVDDLVRRELEQRVREPGVAREERTEGRAECLPQDRQDGRVGDGRGLGRRRSSGGEELGQDRLEGKRREGSALRFSAHAREGEIKQRRT